MLISCLTITQKNRFDLLKKSIKCFSEQTYSSKELIIVHHEDEKFSNVITNICSKYQIVFRVILATKKPLSELRNISIKNANGSLLCLWDDDDLYHPSRLKVQSSIFYDNEDIVATTLYNQMYYFKNRREIFVRYSGKDGIHGTIMFKKLSFLIYPENIYKGEDSYFIEALKKLKPNGIHCIKNHPHIYLRIFHDKNTWGFDHHYLRLEKKAYDRNWINDNIHLIKETLNHFEIKNVSIRDFQNKVFSI
jgi:glycosyltransferase involved in cell wall biosynthesis